MNTNFFQKRKFLIIGIACLATFSAFKFIGSNAKGGSNANVVSAGFYSSNANGSLPCVASYFENALTDNNHYKSLKWSKAAKNVSVAGADSVIVHGYRMRNTEGTYTTYTKLIYFNDNCEVIRVE